MASDTVTGAPAKLFYDAFISYSHAKDKPVGAALQTVIQKLGKPWYQRRSLRVFRDDTSLAATPELWPTLEKVLDQSRFVIVLASPQFARSKWCGMEVEHWLRHKTLDTLLIAVTDGDLLWDAAASDFVWDENTPLPPVLRGHFRNEPKWIDLRAFREAPDARDPKFIDAAADLAAAVRGVPKEDLLSQELRQQKRALRLASAAAAALTLLAAGAGWQWWEADHARRAALVAERVATEQRDLAERNLGLARKAADDLVFKIAQGLRGIEGMRTESVRQILETAQGVMDELARSAPDDAQLQRSRFAMLLEFAVTYERVGDLTRAQAAAEGSLAIARTLAARSPGDSSSQRDFVVGIVKVGDIQSRSGRERDALATYERGLGELRKLSGRRWDIMRSQGDLAIMLDKVGRIRSTLGDKAGAISAFEEAIGMRRQSLAVRPGARQVRAELASGLADIGSIHLDQKNADKALAAFEESMALRRELAKQEPGNLEHQRNLVVGFQRIGLIRKHFGDNAGMTAAFEESLVIMRRLMIADPGNAVWRRTLGVTMFQVADARLAKGDRAGALAMYREALELRQALARTDPRNAQWQLDVITALFRTGTAAPPAEGRAMLDEALVIAEKMVSEGRLAGNQASWPQIIRSQLARMPAVSSPPAAAAAGGVRSTEATPPGR